MGVRVVALSVALWVGSLAGSAGATCFDGLRDGYETDVDCGGDCAPCPEGNLCRIPHDCASSRCGEGQCQEQRYESGARIPNGYHLESSRSDGASIARIIGLISFGVGYGGAYAAAVSLPGELSWLYVPVVGPWVEVGNPNRSLRGLYAVDGLLQTVGGGLLVGGMIATGKQLVRDDAPFAKVEIVPTVTVSGAGMALLGYW